MHPSKPISVVLAVALVLLACIFSALADSTTLLSAADATLLEVAPDNNNGGMAWFNCGTTQNGTRNRGLLKFDIAGGLPPNSKITWAYLTIYVTHHSDAGLAVPYFDLHRVLRNWDEGTNTYDINGGSPGQGTPATSNQVTWNDRLALTGNPWDTPGGTAGIDYATNVSASQIIFTENQSPYYFSNDIPDAPQLISDIQLWLDRPETNFGWMMICEDESVYFSARRIASREDDPFFAPQLYIEYLPPPSIDQVTASGNQFSLYFTAQAGTNYTVEFRNSPFSTNAWSTLTNIPPLPAPTNLVVSDTIAGTQRFYRLRVH